MKFSLLCLLFALLGCTCLCGCGAGSESPVQPKNVLLTFSTMSTSTLPTRIKGIQLDAIVPPEANVAVEPGNPRQISVSTLKGLASSGMTVFGSYSAGNRSIRIVAADISDRQGGIPLGDFATLTCPVTSGTIPLPSGFIITGSKVTGLPLSGGDSLILPVAVIPKVTYGY